MISLLRFHHQIFLNFANILFSRFENSQKFRADLFSRFEGPNIFARTKFREIGQKPRKPRKLIRAKIYQLKVVSIFKYRSLRKCLRVVLLLRQSESSVIYYSLLSIHLTSLVHKKVSTNWKCLPFRKFYFIDPNFDVRAEFPM